MRNEIIRYTLRADKALLRKLRYIAAYEGRSANRQMKHFLKCHVAEFEVKYGKIEVENEDE